MPKTPMTPLQFQTAQDIARHFVDQQTVLLMRKFELLDTSEQRKLLLVRAASSAMASYAALVLIERGCTPADGPALYASIGEALDALRRDLHQQEG